MANYLSSQDKYDYQHNYRRFQKHFAHRESANEALKHARNSRIWIAGIIVLFFAMGSDFFLGVAGGIFLVYFWQVIGAWMQRVKADEAKEEIERWFNSKGLVFQDQTLFFRADAQLANPVDPLQEAVYQ